MALIAVADALARVLDGAAPLPSEDVPLAKAHGRVLAADLAARRTQPPGTVSAMDGYAVRGADVAQAPARLALVGEVAAGRPTNRAVGPGEAIRIFTGGVLPDGADTVVVQEIAVRDGDAVAVTEPVRTGKNVRPAALDFAEGAVLLRRGRLLSARDVALAAAMNHATLPVHRRPRVAVISTGDELVAPGGELGPGRIVSSNGFALAALAAGEGALVTDHGIVPDRLDATVAEVRAARDGGADVLVTAGGASVGDYDLVQPALAAEGLELAFWKVALRPGKPLLHGRLGGMRVVGLPGNPVSSFVCAFLFLVPLIRRLSGRTDVTHPVETALLGAPLPPNDERADYLRATLARDTAGHLVATPFPLQDSSLMVPLASADCLLLRDPFAPAALAGTPCRIVKLGL